MRVIIKNYKKDWEIIKKRRVLYIKLIKPRTDYEKCIFPSDNTIKKWGKIKSKKFIFWYYSKEDDTYVYRF
jgi:hypothetical protein